ncbi:hypothetical protein AALA22_13010 [Anaerovoracaceae bacterium 41-7]
MDKQYIYLLMGQSGAGKTTIANILKEVYKWRVLDSYTTRKPRYDGEVGHIFCTKEEFDGLQNKVAYTIFDGNEYCATAAQVEESDIYVIDPAGIDKFMSLYNGNKEIVLVKLIVSRTAAKKRMLQRGDNIDGVSKRIEYDKTAFDYKPLKEIDLFYDTDKLMPSVVAMLINDDKDRREEYEKIYCSN